MSYEAMKRPVCLCGRQVNTVNTRYGKNVVNRHLIPIARKIFGKSIRVRMDANTTQIWVCACRHCGVWAQGSTKREATERFEREVTIDVR